MRIGPATYEINPKATQTDIFIRPDHNRNCARLCNRNLPSTIEFQLGGRFSPKQPPLRAPETVLQLFYIGSFTYSQSSGLLPSSLNPKTCHESHRS